MAEETKKQLGENKHLTTDEIRAIIDLAKQPGLRFTVDLYLLDYIKHCFLEDGQLSDNIEKLNTALTHLENPEVKKGVEDVIRSLQCVQSEYTEYIEDMRVLANGDYPGPRGAGQLLEAI